jgi:site-specific recombinase XerD
MSGIDKHLEDYQSYMVLKNYSKQTIASYLRTVRMFFEYCSVNEIPQSIRINKYLLACLP